MWNILRSLKLVCQLCVSYVEDYHFHICTFTIFQVRIKLNENNDIAAIKSYLATDLQQTQKGRYFIKFAKLKRKARRAFREIYQRLKEASFGNRPGIPNVCFLLVNEKRTSRHLMNSGINTLCDHTFVFSGEDKIDFLKIQKKVCPEAQIIRGKYIGCHNY